MKKSQLPTWVANFVNFEGLSGVIQSPMASTSFTGNNGVSILDLPCSYHRGWKCILCFAAQRRRLYQCALWFLTLLIILYILIYLSQFTIIMTKYACSGTTPSALAQHPVTHVSTRYLRCALSPLWDRCLGICVDVSRAGVHVNPRAHKHETLLSGGYSEGTEE